MPNQKRKIQYVGERIQKVLAVRAAVHWALCLTVVFSCVFVSRLLSEPQLGMISSWKYTWTTLGPSLLLASCFLPWVVISNLRLSNRFAGPLSRIRSSLQCLRAGKRIAPIRIRKRDFFHDLVEETNSLAQSIGQLKIPDQAPERTIAPSHARVTDRHREFARSS